MGMVELPEEVMHVVFQMVDDFRVLPVLERVCKYWRYAAMGAYRWYCLKEYDGRWLSEEEGVLDWKEYFVQRFLTERKNRLFLKDSPLGRAWDRLGKSHVFEEKVFKCRDSGDFFQVQYRVGLYYFLSSLIGGIEIVDSLPLLSGDRQQISAIIDSGTITLFEHEQHTKGNGFLVPMTGQAISNPDFLHPTVETEEGERQKFELFKQAKDLAELLVTLPFLSSGYFGGMHVNLLAADYDAEKRNAAYRFLLTNSVVLGDNDNDSIALFLELHLYVKDVEFIPENPHIVIIDLSYGQKVYSCSSTGFMFGKVSRGIQRVFQSIFGWSAEGKLVEDKSRQPQLDLDNLWQDFYDVHEDLESD